MLVVVSTSFIAILLAYLSRYRSFKNGLEWGFMIVTFIACIHYNYGNDYENYYKLWYDIKGSSFQRLFSYGFKAEPGWILINWILGFDGGFYVLVAVLNLIQNFIYYYLIKKYVPRDWYWLAILLYLCDTSLYVLNFSLMRQGLAVALFIGSFLLINKKKYIVSAVIILLMPFIHKSAWVCLPLLLIPLLSVKWLKFYLIIILALTIALFFFNDTVAKSYEMMISLEDFEKYQNYEERLSTGSLGFGFLLGLIPYFCLIYFLLKQGKQLTKEIQMLLLISYLCLLVVPYKLYTQSIVSRIGIYFSAFLVASIPWMYSNIKGKIIRDTVTMIIVFLTMYSYSIFFSSATYGKYYSNFHSIFELI